jgi:hypothetical protein
MHSTNQTLERQRTWVLPLLAALAMSVGWGWRGDYGHEAGALVPGALVALAVCLAAGRADWWERATLLAFLGALGWALGGQMSYGIVIGYTASSSFASVLYGYAGLFLIGALWGSVGAGVLALGITETRSDLERFTGPLVAFYLALTGLQLSGVTDWLSERWPLHDTDWVAATVALLVAGGYAVLRPAARQACGLLALLALGWWLGLAVLTGGLGLRMTPPRSDNWAGQLGLWLALVGYLYRTRNRAALLLAAYGFIAGGVGFAVGDLLNMAGRAQWGVLGRSWTLSGLGSWKWMEQSFGLMMGLGVGRGFVQILRGQLAPPLEDEKGGRLRLVALIFLLILMPWENLHQNLETWTKLGFLAEPLFRLSPQTWLGLSATLLAGLLLWAILQHWRGALIWLPPQPFGRAQVLFLWILWVALAGDFTRALPNFNSRSVLFVHVSFWLTAACCTGLLLALSSATETLPAATPTAEAERWRWEKLAGLAVLAGLVLIFLLAKLTLAMHTEPLPGSRLRW